MAASKAAEPVIALPKPLPFWQATLYRVLLPICIAGIFVGSIGLLILADPEKKYWVSQTKYGEFWRQVTDWNPVTNGVCFNGGILGSIICWTSLKRHQRGKLLQSVKLVNADEIERLRQADKNAKKRK